MRKVNRDGTGIYLKLMWIIKKTILLTLITIVTYVPFKSGKFTLTCVYFI